ncbi:MAG TPA: hypothetical protein VIL04_08880 [Solirubrobacterales bacterium]|jgi:hypothetical protein
MSIGRLIFWTVVAAVATAIVYTGVWHIVVLFVWQHPMLSWLPLLAMIAVGFVAASARAALGAGAPSPSPEATGQIAAGVTSAALREQAERGQRVASRFAAGPGLLAGLLVLAIGLFFTLLSPPASGLSEIEYELVDELPQRTQPRLLPRASVDDDPRFVDVGETHLVRDPDTGELMWSAEWQPALLSGPSQGVVTKPLDDVLSESEIHEGGFDHSVSAIGPSTLKGQARIKHPFSRTQYPVLIPTGERTAIAIAPYAGYRGFPFRHPYLKGVLVYHQDGTVEDLSPEEAAARPELARSGRIVPEVVARAQAEALARSDEFEGEIVDGDDNPQPYLTAIDAERTVWVTIINEKGGSGLVKAVVLADSTTGETQVWQPDEGEQLVSTQGALNEARALPLQWEEERCCDSDGHSYTVTLREVVEPRLVFKDGEPYYLVSVVPTDELAASREIEYTLIVDGRTGETIRRLNHVANGARADEQLQRFFE